MINKGDKIGKLTVLKKDVLTDNGQKWLCQCECGKITSVREDNLEVGLINGKGGTRSCGCLNSIQNHCKGIKRINYIGTVINDYEYILRLFPDSNRSYKFLFQDLTNNLWRVSDTRNIKNLAHNSKYEYKTAKEALKNYYKKISEKKFSSHTEENNIMTMLFKNNIIWTKQYSDENCKDKTPLPFDIAIFDDNFNLSHIIEYDGEQHFFQVSNWDFLKTRKHDLIKNKYCFEHNIPLIRIPYNKEYTFEDLKLETTRFLLTPENEQEYYKR
jgi:hypothetical protein